MSNDTPQSTDKEIPYGYCHCGCGRKTTVQKANNRTFGYIAGEPVKFIHGHNGKGPVEKRFWSKVDKRGPDDCWEWQAGRFAAGYGEFSIDNAPCLAHRVSWWIATGEWPDLYVCHTCDNRLCVNPAHLFLGTFRDNMDDMRDKHRQAKGNQLPFTKLNREKVIEIRRCYAAGEKGVRALAREYGVTHSSIQQVVHRKSWKHL